MKRFDAVAVSLNKGGALPWETDGKPFRDRWRLIARALQRSDKALASSTDQEEEVTECDLLLSIVVEERDVFNESKVEKCGSEVQRMKGFLRAGEEVRALFIRARGGAVSNEDAEDVEVVSEARARNRMREDGDVRASVGEGSMRMMNTDVNESVLELEHKKEEQSAAEKAAKHVLHIPDRYS